MKVVTFGEVMLRLAPENYLRFVQSEKYEATFGGAEANVAVSLSNYGVDAAFGEIEALASACRFSDCTHTSEPGCAVRKALEDGTLDAARWESFRKLKAENRSAADNSKYLEAKREKFKEIAKTNKAAKKNKRT